MVGLKQLHVRTALVQLRCQNFKKPDGGIETPFVN